MVLTAPSEVILGDPFLRRQSLADVSAFGEGLGGLEGFRV